MPLERPQLPAVLLFLLLMLLLLLLWCALGGDEDDTADDGVVDDDEALLFLDVVGYSEGLKSTGSMKSCCNFLLLLIDLMSDGGW